MLMTEETQRGINLPTFCMYSQYKMKAFREYTAERGIDYVIQKPPS